jgi:hypothetical protein
MKGRTTWQSHLPTGLFGPALLHVPLQHNTGAVHDTEPSAPSAWPGAVASRGQQHRLQGFYCGSCNTLHRPKPMHAGMTAGLDTSDPVYWHYPLEPLHARRGTAL